jgi:hypothetical protein
MLAVRRAFVSAASTALHAAAAAATAAAAAAAGWNITDFRTNLDMREGHQILGTRRCAPGLAAVAGVCWISQQALRAGVGYYCFACWVLSKFTASCDLCSPGFLHKQMPLHNAVLQHHPRRDAAAAATGQSCLRLRLQAL